MRLALVTQDFPPVVGGIQTYARALADQLAPRCERFVVLAPGHPQAAALDARLPYPVVRIPVPTDGMRWVLLPYLTRVCAQGRFRTALLAQWYSGAATRLARRAGLLDRVYSAAHGQELLRVPPGGALPRELYARHRRWVLEDVDGFFPVSRYTADLLADLGVPRSRLQVVGNGTDPAHFSLRPGEAAQLASFRERHGIEAGPLLLTAARLVRRKGVDCVLRTLPELVRQVPGVRYAVVGSGPERSALERLARELGVARRVRFLGQLPERELVLAYHACDVFVMPAREELPSVEGFGLVFREANACGKPVVGARTGGIPDAIEHGHNGLLVEPEDVAALTSALARLLLDPDQARQLGARGLELVRERGTWEIAASQMLAAMQG